MKSEIKKEDQYAGRPVWKVITTLVPFWIIAVTVVPWYEFTYGFQAWDWFWFAFFMIMTGISITAGYHRLWSHRAYKANAFLKLIFMFFGAAAFQNSIVKWSSDHRKHHRFVDDPVKDPYAATRGFFYSHVGWLFVFPPEEVDRIENVEDLRKDKIVAFQEKYYVSLAIFSCFVLPIMIGYCYGSIMGCLLLAGFFRLFLNHQFTFFINSLAHIWGRKTFNEENTARDNAFISLVTYGEGYHNFHHKFAGDYRNGIHWYDFDPSKWLVGFGKIFGWTWDLKKTSKAQIEAAKAKMQYLKAQEIAHKKRNAEVILASIESQYQMLLQSISKWSEASRSWIAAKKDTVTPHEKLKSLKLQMKRLRREFKIQKRVWSKCSKNYAFAG